MILITEFQTYGFWITILGTLTGCISLVLTLLLTRSIGKIKKDLLYKNAIKRFKNRRYFLVRDLTEIYDMMKENEFNESFVQETYVKLELHKKVLSKKTRKNIKKMQSYLKNEVPEPYNKNDQVNKEMRNVVYILMQRLQNEELNEEDLNVGEMTK
ncbi:hypothetical protein [Paenibacillus kyungheensis]